MTLEYTLERGALTRLEVHGVELPEEVRTRILGRWATAVFDGFLERDARTLVREHLYRDGRLEAAVRTSIALDQAAGVKTLRIDVDPGRFVPRRLEFAGNAAVPGTRLYAATSAVGPLAAWLDPEGLERALGWVYQAEGLLGAEIDVPEPELRAGTSVVRVMIREGEPFQIGRVTVAGAERLPGRDVRDRLALSAGMPYRSQLVRERVGALERELRQAGFLDARAVVETSVDPKVAQVHVHVRVEPGARSVLADVIVEGTDAARSEIAKAIALESGAPIDPADIATTRRQLYDIGAYRSVDIAIEPRVPPAGADGTGPAIAGDRAVVARLRLEERPQFRFRYGLALNDDVVGPEEREQRLGIAADLDNRDLLGLGAAAGVSARLRRDQQVGRLFLGSTRFFGLPLKSSLFLQRGRQQIGPSGGSSIVADETEISAEQGYRLRRGLELRYGYGIGRNRTLIEDGNFDLRVRIARLTTSGLIDRRENPFDPVGGWFASANVELSRPGLGSDLSFLRSFLQFYRFSSPREGLVVASAARVGLARTFAGQELIPSERFFGGGATSVRGFREDDLGARGLLGDAEGGSALFVLNQELRFPVYRWVRGVGFVDVGNVYPAVGELSLSDLLVSVGAGVRVDTPVGLLRLDIGVPANRRTFDPRWRVHVGLGHAF